MSESTPPSVSRSLRFKHAVQRELGRIIGPLWIPPMVFFLRFILGYRIENVVELREQYRQLREESDAPILICPNHLTLIDSIVVAWALVPWWKYCIHFNEMPWNTPERKNFARTGVTRILVFIAKCIPISRGGERNAVAQVLSRVTHLLVRGEVALVFPEGGRSRTGRVSDEAIAWGVGRIITATPGCRVLCVYMRGDTQESWGSIPNMGETISIDLECFEPKSDARGARRSRDLVTQIVSRLTQMEEVYFDGRQ
ncbi:MAG: 1-acyl-sn-glycerol-3-phosphate acyltransferase [Myxococcota bacterium]